jgi:hypothetical protein
MKKSKLAPSTAKKIVLAPSTAPRINPKEVAKALGAEPIERPPFVFANYPEAPELRSALQQVERQKQEKTAHQLTLFEEDWEKLCALAQELKEGEAPLPPELVGLQLLRQALELLSVKEKFKARLYAQAEVQAGE